MTEDAKQYIIKCAKIFLLMKRAKTPKEVMDFLQINDLDALEEMARKKFGEESIRKGLKLKDVSTMNFLEVREFCRQEKKKKININDLVLELDYMWDEYEITGFDYQYFKESIGMTVSDEFINHAKSIGRYKD